MSTKKSASNLLGHQFRIRPTTVDQKRVTEIQSIINYFDILYN
jgi:hypothetical protein